MRRLIFTAVLSGFLGFIAGNAFWYLFSPLWIDRVVSEDLPAELQMSVAAVGAFRDADTVHTGSGTATIFATAGGAAILRFTDFTVTNGPDLKVWLVKAGNIRTSSDVKSSEWVSLGPLKGNKGNQNYVIPSDTDLSEYRSIVVWCEQFGVLFTTADLAAPQSQPGQRDPA